MCVCVYSIGPCIHRVSLSLGLIRLMERVNRTVMPILKNIIGENESDKTLVIRAREVCGVLVAGCGCVGLGG